MTSSFRGIFPRALALGALLLIGLQPWAFARKGPRISVGDDPSMKEGSPTLVLIEVSDFQCPYCGQGAREMLPQVREQFVRTGKVELIFLDFPLDSHSNAFKAAQAAACAGDQKKFWEMHHQLFSNQRNLAPEKLPTYAQQVGLDVDTFQKCLSSKQHIGEIHEDMRTAGMLGIAGTPAYLIGRRLPGSEKVEILDTISGLPPYEELAKRLNQFLASGNQK